MARKLERTFGDVPFLLESHEHIDIVGELVYVASAYRIENDGRSLRAIADHDGEPLELPSAEEHEALERLSRYLEARFGARRDTPLRPHNKANTVVQEMLPPLSDERATIVRAAATLKKGDNVVITDSVAKPIARHLIGVAAHDQLGRALEDALTGDEVRVWAYPAGQHERK